MLIRLWTCITGSIRWVNYKASLLSRKMIDCSGITGLLENKSVASAASGPLKGQISQFSSLPVGLE